MPRNTSDNHEIEIRTNVCAHVYAFVHRAIDFWYISKNLRRKLTWMFLVLTSQLQITMLYTTLLWPVSHPVPGWTDPRGLLPR